MSLVDIGHIVNHDGLAAHRDIGNRSIDELEYPVCGSTIDIQCLLNGSPYVQVFQNVAPT